MSVPEACFVIFQIVMLRQVSAVIHIVGNLSLPDGIIDGWGGCLDVLVAWFAGGVACWECGLLGVWRPARGIFSSPGHFRPGFSRRCGTHRTRYATAAQTVLALAGKTPA